MNAVRPVERLPGTFVTRCADIQLVRVQTDALELEGLKRGDWIVLYQGETVGLMRGQRLQSLKETIDGPFRQSRGGAVGSSSGS